jgi:predicted AAA+ superfamily ATPase
MKSRPFWIYKINRAWEKRSIVWLAGVRRVGKTTLARMLPHAAFYNCDLPSVVRALDEPEAVFSGQPNGSIVIFDEVHRTRDPSRLLKIAADEYPAVKVLATGSLTLSATRKFRDSLTGRKVQVLLPPIIWPECGPVFKVFDLDRRLLHGGLPEPLQAEKKDPSFFADWMDGFYARDIQELFRVRDRDGFLELFQLVMIQSGGIVDYSRFSKHCGLSRPTVKSHFEAIRTAQAVRLLPPFHGGGRREIISRPKAYGFDTGMVTHVKGWTSIREDDRDVLWEHLVLDVLLSCMHESQLFYWRDKSGREVDFVVKRDDGSIDAVECKINPDHFEPDSLLAFRRAHKKGLNFIISPRVTLPYRRHQGGLLLECCGAETFPDFKAVWKNGVS